MYSEGIGGVSWIDLTVKDAAEVKDFYKEVIGLGVEPLSMGDYDDYVMKSPDDKGAQVGICHAKGANADIPPQWMVYFNVADIDKSSQQCVAKGGEILKEKSDMGDFYMCVIKDPAGAVAALITKK